MGETSAEEALPAVPGYRLLRRIGRGGFSVVYEAVQLSLDRLVAVKVLMLDLGSPGDRRRFDRERESLTRLGGHPHVVDVVDAGLAPDGRPFLVMKLYPRGSLDQVLTGSATPALDDVVRLIGEVASALDHAHAHGVLHRDVAPKNVLLGDEGQAVLADFGIAGLAAPTEGASTTFLTAAHAAPEVLVDERHSVASDVYSLASTAYALLAGHAPWGNARLKALMAAPYAPAPPLPRPDVPEAVRRAIALGLAPLPQQRPATAGEFARLLATCAAGGVGRAGGAGVIGGFGDALALRPPERRDAVGLPGERAAALAQERAEAAATVLRSAPQAPGAPRRPAAEPERPFVPGPPLDDAGVAAHIRAEAAREAALGPDADPGVTRDTAGLPTPAPWRGWGLGRGADADRPPAAADPGDKPEEPEKPGPSRRTGRRWWGRD